MAGIILTADIGTSSLKAAFVDLDGRLLCFSRIAYAADSDGKVDSSAWLHAFALALGRLYGEAPGTVVDGICFSGNGPTLVPVTAGGKALSPLYWHDRRVIPSPKGARSFFLPRAAWVKHNAPEIYSEIDTFISSHEWLAYELGADALTVLPQGSYVPFYWDDDQCDLFQLDRKKFPPFIRSGTVMGNLSVEAAASLGPFTGGRLKSGTPFIAGGPDFITALIGTGVSRIGEVCDRSGTSEGINYCASLPVDSSGVRVFPHAMEGLWNIGAVIPSSGRLFEWYRSFTGQDDVGYGDHLAELIPLPIDVNLFNNSFFFHPSSPESYPQSLHHHDKTKLGRAVLCAMGFAVREAAGVLESRGFHFREMRVSGGQCKNSRWNRLKADITGLTLEVPEIPDGELAGNAVLAALALGAVSNLEEGMAGMIRFRDVYSPQSDRAAFWDERYRLYVEDKPPEGVP